MGSLELLDMPDVVMNKILEKCDFVSIQILRKVCWDLRNFIEKNPPVTTLDMEIQIYLNNITLILTFERTKRQILIDYHNHDNGNGILYYTESKNDVKLINEDYKTAFLRDFKCYVKQQKAILDNFRVTFYSNEEVLFKFNEERVKVQVVTLTMQNPDFIPTILSNLDPNIVSLQLESQDYELINLYEIVKMEAWIKARRIKIDGFQICFPIRKFQHFENVYINFQGITLDYIKEIKEAFLDSCAPKKLHIYYVDQSVYELLETMLGDNFEEPDPQTRILVNKWFIRIPDSDNVMYVKYSQHLDFECVNKNDVPCKYVIKD